MKERRPGALEHPDIEFTANVRAREMRFDEVPEAEVRFWGRPRRASASETERKNLPEEVRRGVTYRNSSVRLRIATEVIETEPGLQEEAGRSRGRRMRRVPEASDGRAKAPEEGGRSD